MLFSRLRHTPHLATLRPCLGAILTGFVAFAPLRTTAASAPNPLLPTWESLPTEKVAALTFRPVPERLSTPAASQGEILLDRAAFARLADALASDPGLDTAWNTSAKTARTLLADGNWSRRFPNPQNTERYTYVVSGILPQLALLRVASGQEDLGRLVRLLTLDLVRRPMEFWIHARLRKYDPAAPVGQIETAQLLRGVALAWQWSRELFSDAENAEIRAGLIDKGLAPCVRWLEKPFPRNNFMAVIGGGTLVAARVLEDAAASELATRRMEEWLSFFQDDGSYGEPVGYFEYGAAAFFEGWWALGRDEGRARLRRHPALKGTLPWMAAHYVLHRDPAAPAAFGAAWRVNFGDDDFTTAPSPLVCESLAFAFDDGLGAWMSQNLAGADGRRPLNISEFLFRLGSLTHPLPPPSLPASSAGGKDRLATARIPDAGPAILRSGWTFGNDIVLALRGGGGARTGWSHDRGNRNAFMLFVDGELFFAAPGRASYRSPLAREWDWRIGSHCAVSIDNLLQRREHLAHYTHFSDDGNLVQIASEAASAYRESPRSVARRIWLDRKHGLIAIEDIIRPAKPAAIGWHLLLANHDGRGQLAPPAPVALGEPASGWRFRRPGGEIVFWIHADHPLQVEDAPGILHTAYSYSPGDAGEGKPGSARHLTWRQENGALLENLRVWTLILTRSQNAPDARAAFAAPTAAAGSGSDNGPVWIFAANGSGGRQERLTFVRGADNQDPHFR
ncbi:Heparinase II/III-like protein [Opitutaceae bacterium TAV1]|nr:Heparinase II/III-like protein [Opitutaceae bacterium TAV1]